jgi:hypothetical protein
MTLIRQLVGATMMSEWLHARLVRGDIKCERDAKLLVRLNGAVNRCLKALQDMGKPSGASAALASAPLDPLSPRSEPSPEPSALGAHIAELIAARHPPIA